MAKLTILAAALLGLLVLAQATRTTITTTVVEDEAASSNPGQQGRCREQIRRQQNLRSCQRYMQEQAREGGSRGGYEADMVITEKTNPGQQQQLRQCCQQLENLNEQCRCEGVREAFRQQREQGEMQGEEVREMMREAENLPQRCNLSPRRCQMRDSVY